MSEEQCSLVSQGHSDKLVKTVQEMIVHAPYSTHLDNSIQKLNQILW